MVPPPSVVDCVASYRKLPRGEGELEVRLGNVDAEGRFAVGVTREVFDQLTEELAEALGGDTGWTEQLDYHYTLARGDHARTRVSCDAERLALETTHLIKTGRGDVVLRRVDDDLGGAGGQDGSGSTEGCRVACASEVRLPDPPGTCVPTHVRIKQRRTFRDVRDGAVVWAYELSRTWSAGSRTAVEHLQHVSPPTYEVECELVDADGAYLAAHTDEEIASSLLLKAQGLLGDDGDDDEGLCVVRTSGGAKKRARHG